MRLALTILILTTLPAYAADYATRSNDLLFDKAALTERVTGQSLVFYDNGVSEFRLDGIYTYTYNGGNAASGQYQVNDDSTICIAFENEFHRCDLYVQNAAGMVLLTEDGMRFPIRP